MNIEQFKQWKNESLDRTSREQIFQKVRTEPFATLLRNGHVIIQPPNQKLLNECEQYGY
jgi:hypothetical protein